MNDREQMPVPPRSRLGFEIPSSLGEIAERYHYAPLEEEKRRDLGIQWESIDMAKVLEAMARYDELPLGIGQFFLVSVPNRHGKEISLTLRKEHAMIDGAADLLSIRLTVIEDPMEQFHESAAELSFTRFERTSFEEWEMRHRLVAARYRQQGIADHLLRVAERAFQHRSAATHRAQIIEAEVGQGDVLWWLVRRGYIPANEINQQRIRKFFSGSDELVILNQPGGARRWYIFEKSKAFDHSGKLRSDLWDGSQYQEISYRIRVTRTF
ncbi:MAG: hypothetical protein AAB483_01640 [Patescibacteria group bacterium]|mgnify:CR=1 FL=1